MGEIEKLYAINEEIKDLDRYIDDLESRESDDIKNLIITIKYDGFLSRHRQSTFTEIRKDIPATRNVIIALLKSEKEKLTVEKEKMLNPSLLKRFFKNTIKISVLLLMLLLISCGNEARYPLVVTNVESERVVVTKETTPENGNYRTFKNIYYIEYTVYLQPQNAGLDETFYFKTTKEYKPGDTLK